MSRLKEPFMEVVGYSINENSYSFKISRSDMDLLTALVERNETYDQGISNFDKKDKEVFEAALAQAVTGEEYDEISFKQDFFHKIKSMVFQMTYMYVPEDLRTSIPQREELVKRMEEMWPQMDTVAQQTVDDAEMEKLVRDLLGP